MIPRARSCSNNPCGVDRQEIEKSCRVSCWSPIASTASSVRRSRAAWRWCSQTCCDRDNCLWFGWSGEITSGSDLNSVALQKAAATRGHGALATVALSEDEHRDYYLGYSNSVLWPVFHNRLDLAKFGDGFYERYRAVNERFAQSLLPLLTPDDTIWVHDYHLIPLGRELRKLGVANPIGFFLHIPVPPSQTFLAIPEHQELAAALADYDLVGLQTKADVANLIRFLEESVSGRILQDGRIGVLDRHLSVRSFPAGIDPGDFARARPAKGLVQGVPGVRRIIGVDRLDYSKGLPEKFRAFGRFLEKYPSYRQRIVLTQIAPPTRESVEAYSDIRAVLEGLSGQFNGKFGELDWVPIHYIHRSATRRRLRDIYRASSIGLVTPLRDGMNLVVKEYIAAQDPLDPGVAILSRFAGAAEDLRDALIVNPYNADEVADAIRDALEMPVTERIERHERLMQSIEKFNNAAWSQAFLSELAINADTRRSRLTHVEWLRSVLKDKPSNKMEVFFRQDPDGSDPTKM